MIPSRKICGDFRLTYELRGAQKAVDAISKYYGIRRMRIVVDGRRVGNTDDACYYENVAYFKKRGLNRKNVLHEFYHHLVYVYDLDLSDSREEREANRYAKTLLKK